MPNITENHAITYTNTPITLTLFFSWFIMDGNDVGKVVVWVDVATGIFGRVVPYVFCLYPTPRDGNVDC